jgi:hypothetical protein
MMYRLWLFVRYFKRVGELDPSMSWRARQEAAWHLAGLMSEG